MELYGNAISKEEIARANRHMINMSNLNGSFSKAKLRTYIEANLQIPGRVQLRNSRGQFAHVVSPSDELADRLIQRSRKAGRAVKLARVGRDTRWAWQRQG